MNQVIASKGTAMPGSRPSDQATLPGSSGTTTKARAMPANSDMVAMPVARISPARRTR